MVGVTKFCLVLFQAETADAKTQLDGPQISQVEGFQFAAGDTDYCVSDAPRRGSVRPERASLFGSRRGPVGYARSVAAAAAFRRTARNKSNASGSANCSPK